LSVSRDEPCNDGISYTRDQSFRAREQSTVLGTPTTVQLLPRFPATVPSYHGENHRGSQKKASTVAGDYFFGHFT
jgi:hypothetical protein